jgi:RNA polymerase sigma-70 factor (ECF subfamily)
MGALQSALSNVRPPVTVIRLPSSVRREEERRMNSREVHRRHSTTPDDLRFASEDWALVQQSIAGDKVSQDKLFAAHTTKLYRTAFRVLRNKEDAEDAVQDGLCRAYAKLRTYRGRSAFSTWLTRIVINSALMIRRRKIGRTEVSLDEILENQPGRVVPGTVDPRPDPEKICRVSQINGLLEKEIQKLPAAVQRAFNLHEIEGLSTAESMQALGIRKNAFKSRILRARRRLAGALQSSLQAPVRMMAHEKGAL